MDIRQLTEDYKTCIGSGSPGRCKNCSLKGSACRYRLRRNALVTIRDSRAEDGKDMLMNGIKCCSSGNLTVECNNCPYHDNGCIKQLDIDTYMYLNRLLA